MFPSQSTPNRFGPRGSFSNNQSPGRFSPQQSPEYHFSRNISPPNFFHGSNQYSPRNSTPNMFSPLNNPNRTYSPNASSPFDSPQRQPFSPSPRSRPYWNNKRSYNQSRTSSEYYSSGNSSFNDSARGSPSYRKRNSFKGNSGKEYNIREYVNPSMLKNPWAELEKEISLKLKFSNEVEPTV